MNQPIPSALSNLSPFNQSAPPLCAVDVTLFLAFPASRLLFSPSAAVNFRPTPPLLASKDPGLDVWKMATVPEFVCGRGRCGGGRK